MVCLKETIDGSKKIFIGRLLALGLIFISGLLIARTLGVETYGRWALLQAVFGTVSVLVGFRTIEALTFHLVRAKEKANLNQRKLLIASAITVDLIVSVFVLIVGVVVVTAYQKYALDSALTSDILLWIFGLSFIPSFLSNTWASIIRIQDKFWRMVSVPIFINFIKLLGVSALWLTDTLSIMSLIFLTGSTALIQGIIQYHDIKIWLETENIEKVKWKILPWGNVNLKDFWDMLRAGFLTSSITGVVKKADVLFLGYWRDESEVGIYHLAKNLISVVQSPFAILSKIMFKDVAEWIEKKQTAQGLSYLISKTLKIFPLMLLAFILIGCVFWYVIPYVYGDEYKNARVITSILLIGVLFSSSLFWVYSYLLAMERFREYVKAMYINSILALLGYVLLTREMGVHGTAISLSLAWALGHFIVLYYVIRFSKTKNVV